MKNTKDFTLKLILCSIFLITLLIQPGLTTVEVDEFSAEFIEIREYHPSFVTKESHRINREIDRWFLLTATGEDNNTSINPDEPKVNWGAVMGFDEWLRLPDGERVVAIRHLAVYINTPADNAGMLFNDALYEIDGKRLAEKKGPGRNNFSQILDEFKPGDRVIMKFVRGAKPETPQETDWYNGEPSKADLVGGEMMETEVVFDTRPVEEIPEGPYYWRTTKAFPMETTLSMLLTEFNLWDDFTGMTRSMDKISRRDLSTVRIFDDRPAPFRLPVVTDILRHPSSCANISRMMGDDVIEAIEGEITPQTAGIPVALEYLGKFGTAKGLLKQKHLDYWLDCALILDKRELGDFSDKGFPYDILLDKSAELVTDATKHLSDEDCEFLIEQAKKMAIWEDDEDEDIREKTGEELRTERIQTNEERIRFFRLADSIDMVKMAQAANLLTILSEESIRSELLAEAERIRTEGTRSLSWKTNGLRYDENNNPLTYYNCYINLDTTDDSICIGTEGHVTNDFNNLEKAESRNIMGWERPYRPSVNLIIDLGGDDTYTSKEYAQACGLLGVSVIIDFDGDDVYIGGTGCQGAGILGVGALIDLDGNDRYIADGFAQGAGLFGIGVLLDESRADLEKETKAEEDTGNDKETAPVIQKTFTNSDKYEIGVMGQGFGFTGGFGLLYDRHGSDIYTAGWKHGDYRRPGRGWDSMAQGFGWGMRPWSNDVGTDGGIGLLIDRKGHDNYLGDHFCQGSSYWYALGVLIDDEGHDRYMCGTYSQGSGIHLSAGALIDGAGDDMYTCYNALGQGNAHDWATGMMIDGGGNDRYFLGSGGQGGGGTVSFSMLIDFGGDDHYNANNLLGVQGFGDIHPGRGESSFGVLLDLGEGDDWYADQRLTDGIIAHKRHHGLFLDDGINTED